ncbi:hypothetical protein [Candidatus Formimonas warabiya]|uniref:Uncharacterized protein n=1 Tax=Formimonas warabiya TaxID=1761012 RepID=A0A3G1KVE7_FORW1|nr:hypothetical protein [Candidatus Formimonas warabiya]ATW26424.1 hypothetical protein DCMF_18180 [Candidatus Formimonas warabiya]
MRKLLFVSMIKKVSMMFSWVMSVSFIGYLFGGGTTALGFICKSSAGPVRIVPENMVQRDSILLKEKFWLFGKEQILISKAARRLMEQSYRIGRGPPQGVP